MAEHHDSAPTGGASQKKTPANAGAEEASVLSSAANKVGESKSTNPIPQENPSILSSAGAIGKQFNPDGAIGSIGQKVGGPFDRYGVVGSQFDAAQDGIAGHVERAVDGPRNPAGSSK